MTPTDADEPIVTVEQPPDPVLAGRYRAEAVPAIADAFRKGVEALKTYGAATATLEIMAGVATGVDYADMMLVVSLRGTDPTDAEIVSAIERAFAASPDRGPLGVYAVKPKPPGA